MCIRLVDSMTRRPRQGFLPTTQWRSLFLLSRSDDVKNMHKNTASALINYKYVITTRPLRHTQSFAVTFCFAYTLPVRIINDSHYGANGTGSTATSENNSGGFPGGTRGRS